MKQYYAPSSESGAGLNELRNNDTLCLKAVDCLFWTWAGQSKTQIPEKVKNNIWCTPQPHFYCFLEKKKKWIVKSGCSQKKIPPMLEVHTSSQRKRQTVSKCGSSVRLQVFWLRNIILFFLCPTPTGSDTHPPSHPNSTLTILKNLTILHCFAHIRIFSVSNWLSMLVHNYCTCSELDLVGISMAEV